MGKYADMMVGKRGDAATSGLCGTAFQGSCPVLVEETKGDLRVHQDYVDAWAIQTALAIPVFFQGQLGGALMALRGNQTFLEKQNPRRYSRLCPLGFKRELWRGRLKGGF